MRLFLRGLNGRSQALSLRSLYTCSSGDAGGNGCGDNVDGKAVVSRDKRTPLRVTMVEGQGSGPTMCAAVRDILKAAGVQVQWDIQTMHMHRDPSTGRFTVNADLVRSALETGLVLRSPDSIQEVSHSSAALTLNKTLDTHIGVRLFASVDGFQPFGHIRIVNIRDNVSGEYSENEHTVIQGVVQSIKTVNRLQSEALAKFAFDYVVAHGHCRITVLHKANIMRLSDGAFLRACRRVSATYPDVEYEKQKLDSFCLRVVETPGMYDVLLTPSQYGAFASAVCSSLAGGAVMVPSAAFGPRVAVFSTMTNDGPLNHRKTNVSHGISHSISMANPTGMIRSAAWMLSHVGMIDVGLRIDTALHNTIRQGVKTWDMGGTASCTQFTNAIIHTLVNNLSPCDWKRPKTI